MTDAAAGSGTGGGAATGARRISAFRLLAGNRPVALWVVGEAASTLGTAVASVVLPLMVFEATGSPAHTGALAALRVLPYVLLGLVAGPAADRFSRRAILVWGTVAEGLVLSSLPLAAAITGTISLPHIYVAALIGAACFAVTDAAAFGAVTDVVPTDQLAVANGVFTTVGAAMLVAGPALGGLTVAVVGTTTALWITVGGFGIAASLLWVVRSHFRGRSRTAGGTILDQVRDCLRFIWRERVVAVLLGTGFANSLAAGAVLGQLIVYAVTVLDLRTDDAGIGMLFTAGAVGTLLAGLAFGRIYRPCRLWYVVPSALAGAGASAAGMIWAPSLGTALLLYAGMTLGGHLVIVTGITYRQAVSPPEMVSSVNVVGRMVAWGGQPVGALLGGLVAQAAGMSWMLAGAATVLVLAAVVASLLLSVRLGRWRGLRCAAI